VRVCVCGVCVCVGVVCVCVGMYVCVWLCVVCVCGVCVWCLYNYIYKSILVSVLPVRFSQQTVSHILFSNCLSNGRIFRYIAGGNEFL
jgi:hypothetical protein